MSPDKHRWGDYVFCLSTHSPNISSTWFHLHLPLTHLVLIQCFEKEKAQYPFLTKFKTEFQVSYLSENAIELCCGEQSLVVIRILTLDKDGLFFPYFPEERGKCINTQDLY